MPCTKCRSDFNLFNWKIKCGECEDKYCLKCLKRRDGILYCKKCMILLKRPPDRLKLMELKVKDLQEYLNKNNISTHGLVEKHELVDLFYDKPIPEKQRRGIDKVTANFPASVPNLRPINDFLGNLENVVSDQCSRTSGTSQQYQSTDSQPRPAPSTTQQQPQTHPQPPPTFSNDETQPTTSQGTSDNNSPKDSGGTSGLSTESSPRPPPKYPKLEELGSIDDLHSLSSKELKILLTMNRVDFKGCVEKNELLERAELLWQDKNDPSKESPDNLPIQELCKLCMDAPLDCVLLECGHIATCIDCGKKLNECPICRKYVIRVVRTFKA